MNVSLAKQNLLSAEALREVLSYDPTTGAFVWKIEVATHKKAGKIAGSTSPNGYRVIRFRRHNYLAHRLAWLYVHGVWPSHQIDHVNGVRNDNSLANLRELQHGENLQNQRRAQKDSTTGLLGVTPNSWGGFSARIQVDKHRQNLGSFPTAEQAHDCYLRAKRVMHKANTL